ncbi:PREDICTED: palmitoyl-monogalactosyldiacylglycerol delta-7 desaturase, chloroplastic-like [Nicotiana attenuata]|uniref:Palmitoyl-monogalactosyldiacylglycerol delta-7 desaturase, chloroplastic n=1 Tax=Nicotiana attenuata TaxID=49451 RepID=A0A1J6IVA6_NICAT|nr:PREDICTED: palmitoyl-monogalactosyldiacylglycerol delta-7 desaturase, chloroplastic-like [Nicotiana attenuata]OIT08750.1 palmitoyl-monogalactosyldiacylglycerol delta-7 desaturase, chloroplastic [Nicotiana attenuata]
MALLAPPPSKSKPYPFSPLPQPIPRPARSFSPAQPTKNANTLSYKTTKTSVLNKWNGYRLEGKVRISRRVMPIVNAASTSVSENGKESNFNRILFSDVVVKRPRNVLFGRQWNSVDMGSAAVVVAMHLLCLLAPFNFNWAAVGIAFGLYVITGLLGITLSFHRNLSHRSFKLPKWLEYFFAYCGVQALQGNPIDWVSTHRYHHQFCDSDKDPHSPIEGFWFSHMSWMFDTDTIIERTGKPNNVGDLEKQPFYQFVRDTYVFHPVALAALLYAMGGFPYIVWAMGVRIVWVYHITWLVNSACHVWGKQAWNTGDLSRNNWWVALLAFGEGWHNNHHAFEYSARHGLEWWQLDMTWYVVRFLQAIGLATDVKLPTDTHKQRLALADS